MTIAHCLRVSGNPQLDRAAKTTSEVRHNYFPFFDLSALSLCEVMLPLQLMTGDDGCCGWIPYEPPRCRG